LLGSVFAEKQQKEPLGLYLWAVNRWCLDTRL
jgi:hypothetical protein